MNTWPMWWTTTAPSAIGRSPTPPSIRRSARAAESAGLHVDEIRYIETGEDDDEITDENTQDSMGEDSKTGDNTQTESKASATACKAVADTDNGTIMTIGCRFTKIAYEEAQALPEEYTVEKTNLTDGKAEEITEYLLEQYGEMMGFANPKANVYCYYDEEEDAMPQTFLGFVPHYLDDCLREM